MEGESYRPSLLFTQRPIAMRIIAMRTSNMFPKTCDVYKRGRAPFNLAVYFKPKYSKRVQAILGVYAKPFGIIRFETSMLLIKTGKSPILVAQELAKEGVKACPFQLVLDATEKNLMKIIEMINNVDVKVVVRGKFLSATGVVEVNRSFGSGRWKLYLRSFDVFGHLCLGISLSRGNVCGGAAAGI